METSSCALELGLWEGHSRSHWPGMGGQSEGHAISGLLSEIELDQNRLPGARNSFGEWVLGRVRRFVMRMGKVLASCKQVFLGKGKWGGVWDVSPQLSKLPGKACMPEKEVEIPLVPEDRRNSGSEKRILLAPDTHGPVFLLLGCSGRSSIYCLDGFQLHADSVASPQLSFPAATQESPASRKTEHGGPTSLGEPWPSRFSHRTSVSPSADEVLCW